MWEALEWVKKYSNNVDHTKEFFARITSFSTRGEVRMHATLDVEQAVIIGPVVVLPFVAEYFCQ